MRANLLFAAVLALAPCVHAQGLAAYSPHPTLLQNGWFESWSMGSSACGFVASTSCNNTWINAGGGTPASLATMPNLSAANWAKAGPQALKITTVGATAGYIKSSGFIPYLPAGSTFDRFFVINATSPNGAFDLTSAISITDSGLNSVMTMFFNYNGTTLGVNCGGGSNETLSLNALHVIQFHAQSGSGSSWINVDGGAHSTCTEGTGIASTVVFGSLAGNLDAETFYVGMVYDSAAFPQQMQSPGLFINGNGATTGATVALADLANGAGAYGYCNGSWTAGPLGASFTWSSTETITPHTPVTVAGIQHSVASPPMSLRIDNAGGSGGGGPGGYAGCVVATQSPAMVEEFYFYSDVVASGGGAVAVTRLTSTGDYSAVNLGWDGGSGQLATGVHTNDSGATSSGNLLPITTGTWYVGTLLLWPGHPGTMAIYETSTWTLVAISVGAASPYGSNPLEMDIGDVGAGSGTGHGWISNVTLDSAQGRIQTLTNVSTALCANVYPGCLAATDLVIDGASNTKVTSASHNFYSGDVGRVLTITAGAGFTAGAYTIISTASNAATLSASAGTLGSTGGSWDFRTVTIGALRP